MGLHAEVKEFESQQEFEVSFWDDLPSPLGQKSPVNCAHHPVKLGQTPLSPPPPNVSPIVGGGKKVSFGDHVRQVRHTTTTASDLTQLQQQRRGRVTCENSPVPADRDGEIEP